MRLEFLLQHDGEPARETELEVCLEDFGYQDRHILLDRVRRGRLWRLECSWEENTQLGDTADAGIQPKIRIPDTNDPSRLIRAARPDVESLLSAVQADEQLLIEELSSVGCKRFSGYFEGRWVQGDRRVALLNQRDDLVTEYRDPRMAYHVYLRLVATRVAGAKELSLLEWRVGEWQMLHPTALAAFLGAVPLRR